MIRYFFLELKNFFLNRKNLIIMTLLFSVSIYYAVVVTDHYEPIESVNYEMIKSRTEDRIEFLEKVDPSKAQHPALLSAIMSFPKLIEIDQHRIEALEKNDLKKYAQYTHESYFMGDMENPKYFSYGVWYAELDAAYGYQTKSKEYLAYSQADYPLSIDQFEERTAIQTVVRLFNSFLPYVLLIVTLLLSNDIVTKDRKHQSLINGYPMTNFSKLIQKGLVGFIGTLAVFLLFIPAYLIIGLKVDFGHLKLPIGHYQYAFLNQGTFDTITVQDYLIQVIALLLLWMGIMIAFNLLLSVLFKNEFINLLIASILFVPMLYLQRGALTERFNYWPFTFVEIGKVVTGHLNYLYNLEFVSPLVGYQVLGVTLIVLILLIYITTRLFKKIY